MAHGRDVALALAPAFVGAIKDGHMLGLEMRRAFHRHGAGQGLHEDRRGFFAEGGLHFFNGNDKAWVEGSGQFGFPGAEFFFGKALGQQIAARDAGRGIGDVEPAHHVAFDVLDLPGIIAQAHHGLGNGTVH